MSRHYNSVQLRVNLTQDPELEYTPQNTAVCTLSVAHNREYGDDDHTSYFDVTVWGKQGENCAEYLETGSLVFIDGRLKQSRWTNDKGENRSKVGIVAEGVDFLHSPSSGGNGSRGGQATDKKQSQQEQQDDIPF